MPSGGFTESVVEEAALEWFRELGYTVLHGPDIAPESATPERAAYTDVILATRLTDALVRLNPDASLEAREEAFRRVSQLGSPSLVLANREFHKLLLDGVAVEVLRDGEQRGELLRLMDLDDPAANDWLAVNQFTVVGETERRPDIVIFVNGLPLAVIELKNMADPKATIDGAFRQLQTYQAQIPRLFHFNELLVISDGGQTEIGCITTPRERFAAWKTIDGEELLPSAELSVAIRGVFEHRRFLDLIGSFVVFEDDGKTVVKKVAQYHQFHAVQKALATALRATREGGDGKGGVLWHTQGSGKSLTMLFFAGKLIAHPAMANPTIVMLTDRTDLDNQLFDTFAKGRAVLRQKPVQAESRAHLRQLLRRNAGGVIFTTIQKFLADRGTEDEHPVLSDRRNAIPRLGSSARVDLCSPSHSSMARRKSRPGAAFTILIGSHLRSAKNSHPPKQLSS
jgi:type I restriction enzyme R subunit